MPQPEITRRERPTDIYAQSIVDTNKEVPQVIIAYCYWRKNCTVK